MNQTETDHFDQFYQQQLKTLKLQGMSKSTISSYSRAIKRVTGHFDCCPGWLDPDQLKDYFADLVGTHSWSTVKGEGFLKSVLQYVLSKGGRRVRDYGFLYSNAKKLLFLVQMILHMQIGAAEPWPAFRCVCCKSEMMVMFFVGNQDDYLFRLELAITLAEVNDLMK